MDPQEIITQIHDRLERAIGGVCKMEDGTEESIKRVYDIVKEINGAMLMLHGLRFAVRHGSAVKVSVWPEPDEREIKNGWTD